MDTQRGVTTSLDAEFGDVRVLVDQELVTLVAAHGAHPHDLIAAGRYARQFTGDRDQLDLHGDDPSDALILMYPRVQPVSFDLRSPGFHTTGVPM